MEIFILKDIPLKTLDVESQLCFVAEAFSAQIYIKTAANISSPVSGAPK